ncbi:MAG: ABC transporter permease [Ruminococcus sp.]|nr:ABC transporter permease [Ruminococcus sp.]
MKFLHTLKQDLNKTIINAGFVGAALISCLLAFTANAYRDDTNDKSYSIFEAFTSFDRKFIESHSDFASVRLFGNGLSGYIMMFLPIIVAFPFMVSFCAERNNGLMRFTISRTGRMRYYLSKFTASFLSGGLAVMIGMMLFGAIVFIAFPPLSQYKLDPETLNWMYPDGTLIPSLKYLLAAFVYGAFSTLPAFFLSSFCKNPYIITCLPFMLIYVWNTAINKITLKAFETGDYTVYEKAQSFTPSSPMRIVTMNYSEMTPADRNTLIFNGVYLAVMLTGFIVVMNLRTDKGS